MREECARDDANVCKYLKAQFPRSPLCSSTLMDGKKDQRKKEARGSTQPRADASPSGNAASSGEETDWEGMLSTERHRGDLGDMTFCMANYLKETMKMMFMMRSHHMLTDVILEVGSELFHAHKVILAAASPYFKVSLTAVWKLCRALTRTRWFISLAKVILSMEYR